MIRVSCNICHNANPLAELVMIQSNVISRNEQEDMIELGKAMLDHMRMSHERELHGLADTARIINGLLVLRHFDSTTETYTIEREKMRDQASEAIMLGSDEEEDFEEYVDDSGITHSADCECLHCMEDEDEDEDELDEDDEDDEDEDGDEEDTKAKAR